MGVSTSSPSYTYDQIYLPADCFRLCNPNTCFCRGGHHSRSKYVYVERNNPSGRESYRDPVDMLERGMVPPGWGMGNMSSWRPRDYEVMRGLAAQYMANQRGITEVPWGEMMGGGFGGMSPPGMGGGQGYGYGPPAYQQHAPPAPWSQWQDPGPWQNGPEVGNGRRETIDEETRDKIRLLSDIMFGSEADKQEKQVQEQPLKRLQPMIPELAKLLASQQTGLNGAGANGGGMMPGPPPPAGGMPPGAMGMGGMNPYGAAGGMPGMNPMMHPYASMGGMHPMMGGGDAGMMSSGGDMGGGFGRRRNRGRRAMRDFDYEDDDEDDFGGFGRGGRGGRRRRRGRYNFDDDDLFGDRGGEGEYVEPALAGSARGSNLLTVVHTDSRGRGPPPRGPQRPRPSNGGGSTSGGGAVFDTFNDDARFRSVPAGDPQPAQWTSPRATAQPPMATAPPDRILTPVEEPIDSSPPPMPVKRPPPPSAMPISPDRAPSYRVFDVRETSTYPSIPVGEIPFARPIPIRHAHFRPEAGLARPRQDEKNRGEPQAGGPAAAHDISPQ